MNYLENHKTTLTGLALAIAIAIQPIAEGSGYHFDSKTLTKLAFAGLVAAFGYLSKDHDN